jgi:hypothetical protein
MKILNEIEADKSGTIVRVLGQKRPSRGIRTTAVRDRVIDHARAHRAADCAAALRIRFALTGRGTTRDLHV